jgi:hypothetical protein
MAIIVDPDDLDRNQVVFGTENRRLSLYPVGGVVTGFYDPERTTGETISTGVFQDPGATFQTQGIVVGDIFSLKSGEDAGHYEVAEVISETQVLLDLPDEAVQWNATNATGIYYDARNPSGGSIADGVTEQAVYSFSKEEWRNDAEGFAGDDLIRHPFPYEPITREQFEIGGGTAHDLWDYFRDDTRERVRTGGWATVSGTTTDQIYAGVITLGDLETDAQVYYLQIATGTAPVDFVLPGAVNQAIGVFENNQYDYRTYLKLFVRKKFFTYAQAEIADIGVTTLESLVNRFPLTHVADPAIIASDAQLVGATPWTGFQVLSNNTNGVTSDQGNDVGRLTSAGATFSADGVEVGDVLYISAGGSDDLGYFEIVAVGTTTVDVDTSEHGAFTGESGLTFAIRTRYIFDEVIDDGTIAQDTPSTPTGTFTSSAGGFSGTVAANDILRITESPSPYEGVYQITRNVSDTQLEVDTSDQPFPTGAVSNIDYEILEPGMFLQYKEEERTLASTGNLTFTNNGAGVEDTITRASGSWITDGVQEGDLITISGSVSNDGSYVVRSIVSAADIEVDVQHTLTTEGPVGATAQVFELFTRDLNGFLYPFHWRVFGNDGTAAQVYQFLQRELRRTTDIDEGPEYFRGDITDLLMEFATPTGQGLDLFIDDLNANDKNNVTYIDASAVERSFDFVAAGNLNFNNNLQGDSDAVYEMFFLSVPDGDFGTPEAVTVQDSDSNPIAGNVGGAASISWDFAYDSNSQGGRTPGTDADVVVVAIGLQTAQYVRTDTTITRTTGQNISLVSALERNYSNP